MRRICSVVLVLLLVSCARGPKPSAPKAESGSKRSDRRSSSVRQPQPEDSPEVADLLKDYKEAYEEEERVSDPLKPWNLTWFHFNDRLYFWVLKPAATGYRYVLYPRATRVGIRNMIINLGFPGRFLNSALQGRPGAANDELQRFLINSTVGVVGVWDPATRWFHIDAHDEDFDQNLGVWGAGMGIFLTWPLVGPSSVRGTIGWLGDQVLNPIIHYTPVSLLFQVNSISLDEFGYEELLRAALDPYSAVRDAYLQDRRKKVGE